MYEIINGQTKKTKANLIDIVAVVLIFVICLWNLESYERISAIDVFSYFVELLRHSPVGIGLKLWLLQSTILLGIV